jgi:predicted ester cyclase
MGMPATGKPINISGMCVFHITEGKVTQRAEVFDQMTLMQQVGAIPAPGHEPQATTA